MRRITAATFGLAIGLALVGCSSSGSSSTATTVAGATTTAPSGVTTTADGGGGITVPVADGVPVAVEAGDNSATSQFLKVDPTSVKAGKVTFTFVNKGNRQHEMIVLKTDEKADSLVVGADFKVSEDKSVGEISETDVGKTVVKTFDLAAGHYVLVCNIAKHFTQGMKQDFTVTA
ncbi:MAG: sulfocyanin-like copper-binding protein [Actinomycetota bacterium]